MNERDIAEGQATREWYFNRFGVDETQPAQSTKTSIPPTTGTVKAEPDEMPKPEKPRVETVYRGDQPVTVFNPGIDFTKGGSIHF